MVAIRAMHMLSPLLIRLRRFASLKSTEEITFDTVRDFCIELHDFYFTCDALHDYDEIQLLKDCSLEYVNCVDNLLEAGIIDERDDIKLLRNQLEILLVLSSIEGIKDEYTRLVVIPLIEKASEPDERLYFSKELLKLVHLMVENVSSEVKEAIVNDNALQFYKLIDMLSVCADYVHQFTIMKIIFCLFSDEQLQSRVDTMFPGSGTAASDFKNVSRETFNNDIRHFLNNFNSESQRIKSFKFESAFLDSYVVNAPNVLDDNIWVDFNLAIKSITILCNKTSLVFNTSIEDYSALEELTVYFDSVEAVDIVALKKSDSSGSSGNRIQFKLKAPYAVLYTSSEDAANANYLNLINFDSTALNELAQEVLPLIFAHREEDIVCEPKKSDHLTENFSCILTNKERSPGGETFEDEFEKSRHSSLRSMSDGMDIVCEPKKSDHLTENFSCILTNRERSPGGETFGDEFEISRHSIVGSYSTLPSMSDGMSLVRKAKGLEYEYPKSPSIKLRRRAILQNISNLDSSIGRGKVLQAQKSTSSRQFLEPIERCSIGNLISLPYTSSIESLSTPTAINNDKLKNQIFDLEATEEISVNEGITLPLSNYEERQRHSGKTIETNDLSKVVAAESIDILAAIGEQHLKETDSESDKTGTEKIIAEQSQFATAGGNNESVTCITPNADEYVLISSDSDSCDVHSGSTIIITQSELKKKFMRKHQSRIADDAKTNDSEFSQQNEPSIIIVEPTNSLSDTFYSNVTTNNLEPVVGHDHCSKQAQGQINEVDRQQSSEYLQSNQSPVRIDNKKALDRTKQKEGIVITNVTPEISTQIDMEREKDEHTSYEQKNEMSLSTSQKTQSIINIVDDDEQNRSPVNKENDENVSFYREQVVSKLISYAQDIDNAEIMRTHFKEKELMSENRGRLDIDPPLISKTVHKKVITQEKRKYDEDDEQMRKKQKKQGKDLDTSLSPVSKLLETKVTSTPKRKYIAEDNLKYQKKEQHTTVLPLIAEKSKVDSLESIESTKKIYEQMVENLKYLKVEISIERQNAIKAYMKKSSRPKRSSWRKLHNLNIMFNPNCSNDFSMQQEITTDEICHATNDGKITTVLETKKDCRLSKSSMSHHSASMVSSVEQYNTHVDYESENSNRGEEYGTNPILLDYLNEKGGSINILQNIVIKTANTNNVASTPIPLHVERLPFPNATPSSVDIERSQVSNVKQHKQHVKPKFSSLDNRSPPVPNAKNQVKKHVKPASSLLDIETSPVLYVKISPTPVKIQRYPVLNVDHHTKPTPSSLDIERSPESYVKPHKQHVKSVLGSLDIERSAASVVKQHEQPSLSPLHMEISSAVSNAKQYKQHAKFTLSPLNIERSSASDVNQPKLTLSPLNIERSSASDVNQQPSLSPLHMEISSAVSNAKQYKQHAKFTLSPLNIERSSASDVNQQPSLSPLHIERSPVVSNVKQHAKSTLSPLNIERSSASDVNQQPSLSPLHIEKSLAVSNAKQHKQHAKPTLRPLNIERSSASDVNQQPSLSPLHIERSPAVSNVKQHAKSTLSPLNIERSSASDVNQQPSLCPLHIEKSLAVSNAKQRKQHAKPTLRPLNIERSSASDVKQHKQHSEHPPRFGELDNLDEDVDDSGFITLLKSLYKTIKDGTKHYAPNQSRTYTYKKGKRSANTRMYSKLEAKETCLDKTSSDNYDSEVILKQYSDACNKVDKFLYYKHQKKEMTRHFKRVSQVILQEHTKIYDRMIDVDQAYQSNYIVKESIVNKEFKKYLHKYVK